MDSALVAELHIAAAFIVIVAAEAIAANEGASTSAPTDANGVDTTEGVKPHTGFSRI